MDVLRILPILRAMVFGFGAFELDTARIELRRGGRRLPLEPQVFALLALLVEQRDRLVTRDEIIERIWNGRIVSDAAVASRIKSARQALGDDGKMQAFIRTLHGQGFRFVADVRVEPAAAVLSPPVAAPATRPSIAVLPFRVAGDAGQWATIGDALPHELIAELSRMHWLFVIARASSFRLRDCDPAEIGAKLGVGYCLSGTIEISGTGLAVTVELADTAKGNLVWAERFAGRIDDVHRIRAEICAAVVAALEIRIPLHEATQARLTVSENLDAWGAYHLGLQHMYRFNPHDNAAAAALFERAVAQDPGFARAHAGLSFVHFQTAFLHHTSDVDGEIALARRFAERGVGLDPMDPFVNFVMGRSFWLHGDLDNSLGWLERSTAISPNYAQGVYARGWTESLAGRGLEARGHVDLAMRLSPLDPLYYAMIATRAFSHMVEGEDAEAAVWAERAAMAPGAHELIAMIALVAHALNGDPVRAAGWAADVRRRNPALTQADFFRSFPMKRAGPRARVAAVLAGIGF